VPAAIAAAATREPPHVDALADGAGGALPARIWQQGEYGGPCARCAATRRGACAAAAAPALGRDAAAAASAAAPHLAPSGDASCAPAAPPGALTDAERLRLLSIARRARATRHAARPAAGSDAAAAAAWEARADAVRAVAAIGRAAAFCAAPKCCAFGSGALVDRAVELVRVALAPGAARSAAAVERAVFAAARGDSDGAPLPTPPRDGAAADDDAAARAAALAAAGVLGACLGHARWQRRGALVLLAALVDAGRADAPPPDAAGAAERGAAIALALPVELFRAIATFL
jgi:hypothetical protein